jgi:peptide chain release factor 1
MKPSMLAKLDQLANRLVELDELLMSEGATDNMDAYRKMTREHAELGPLVAVYVLPGSAGRYRRCRKCWPIRT